MIKFIEGKVLRYALVLNKCIVNMCIFGIKTKTDALMVIESCREVFKLDTDLLYNRIHYSLRCMFFPIKNSYKDLNSSLPIEQERETEKILFESFGNC